VSGRGAAAVVRFSSLGDVLLAAHVPSFLARVDPARAVHFVTKRQYASILEGHPHIARVHALEEETGFDALVAGLRAEGLHEVYDLHRNWRSARLLASFPGVAQRLARKHAMRRRLWVHARWLKPKPVPPLLESYRTLSGLGQAAPLTPWLREALSEAERARGLERVPPSARTRGFVLLGVGARWGTKRWPEASFVKLAELLERERGLSAVFAVEPGEASASEPPASLSVPFRELAAVASHAVTIVSNDSAVLHLGPALGVPALGVFGGTVPEFGFARQGPRDEVVGIDLACRPCSVHGRDRCPLGHHACMRDLDPERVLDAISRVLCEQVA